VVVAALIISACTDAAGQGDVLEVPSATAGSTTSPATTAPQPAPTTTGVSTTTSTTTTTTTTTPEEPWNVGLEVARALGDAFANGDWDTARLISPLPEWTDKVYEEGFDGLEAVTIFPVSYYLREERVEMWLLQVAHESRPTGPQTSLYCVRWDYLFAREIIERVTGYLLVTNPGYDSPGDAEGGKWRCTDTGDPLRDPLVTPSSAPVTFSPPPAVVACPSGGLNVDVTSFGSIQDFAAVGGSGWVVRAELRITNGSTAAVQLRGASPTLAVSPGGGARLPGSIEPWRSQMVLAPGQSVQGRTSVISGSPASSVYVIDPGGWYWPEHPAC
jgi:hypothetical protein